MQILLIDRDLAAAETLGNILAGQGHHVIHETIRKAAQELLNTQHFDMLFVDPAPQPSARELTLPLRWNRRDDYMYMVLTGHDINATEVARSGMNASLKKPFQAGDIENVMINANRLNKFMHRLHYDESILTDSHIFGQRGFYQLLLSALDRSYRYHEPAFLLCMRVTNLEALITQFGQEQAMSVMGELGNYLSRLHRLSDFLGHTGHNEYALLIMRPAVDTEPQDAIERFATALSDFRDQVTLPIKPEFGLYLWTLPEAAVMFHRTLVS